MSLILKGTPSGREPLCVRQTPYSRLAMGSGTARFGLMEGVPPGYCRLGGDGCRSLPVCRQEPKYKQIRWVKTRARHVLKILLAVHDVVPNQGTKLFHRDP